MGVNDWVLPEVLKEAHCYGGLGKAVVNVMVIAEVVGDVIPKVLEVFAKRYRASVLQYDGLSSVKLVV